MKFRIIIAISLLSAIAACTKTTDYAANAVCNGTSTYSGQTAAILNANCATGGCHNAATKKAGIDLSTYAAASDQFKNNKKNLISIHHGSGAEAMPQGSAKLSDANINLLDCWVKNGCPQ